MEEVFQRTNVVSNGCNGSCCEKFTFAYYPEDLRLMMEAEAKGEFNFIDSLGKERRVFSSTANNTAMVADMLIPLGHVDTNPNGGVSVVDRIKEIEEAGNTIEGVYGDWLVFIDGKWQFRIFTCKHFDTENKICGNYENRPALCRSYGDRCEYQGCTFVSKLKEAEEEARKDFLEGGKFSDPTAKYISKEDIPDTDLQPEV